jgi:hypothetical protein
VRSDARMPRSNPVTPTPVVVRASCVDAVGAGSIDDRRKPRQDALEIVFFYALQCPLGRWGRLHNEGLGRLQLLMAALDVLGAELRPAGGEQGAPRGTACESEIMGGLGGGPSGASACQGAARPSHVSGCRRP